MSKADDIIEIGKQISENPGLGFKILGGIVLAGGTLYAGKKGIDAAYDYFKEKRKRKTEEKRTTEAGKREEKKTFEEEKRQSIKTKEEKQRAQNRRSEQNNGDSGKVELPKEIVKGMTYSKDEEDIPRITLIPNLIRNNQNSIIYGEAGIGKTFLGVQLAADLARGGKSTLFPKEVFSIEPHKVIYYNYEQDVEMISENFLSLPFSLKNLVMIDQDTCEEKLNSSELLLNDIGLRIKSYPQGTQIVVFVDNLNRVIENASAKNPVNIFIKGLEEQSRLAKQKGCILTNIILAHTNRKGELQGTIALKEKAKTVIAFEEIDREHRRLTIIKSNNLFPKIPYILRWAKHPEYGNSCLVFDKIETDSATPTAPEPKEENKTKKEQVIELAEEGLTPSEIAEILGISRQLVNHHLPDKYKTRGKGKQS